MYGQKREKIIDFDYEFNKLNKKLNLLIDRQNNPKKTWVKVGVIQDLTGWDNKWLKKARDNKIVEWRKGSGEGLEYYLQSIDPIFIRKPK